MRDPFADLTEAPSAPSQVDWRWILVKENWSLSPGERETGQAYIREIATRRRDPVLAAMWDFYDELQSNQRTDLEFPAMAQAYEVMTSRPRAQVYIEGMVLCGVPAWEISASCGISPSVITAYEAMFFAGDTVSRLNHKDTIFISRRIAWLMGPGVFHGMYGGGRACPELVVRAEQHIHEITRKSALLRSMVRGHMDEELDISLVQEVVAAARAASQAGSAATGGGFEAKHASAVVSMLSAVTLSVADPSLETTIQQPARDQRTADIVAEVVKTRALQPVEAEA